MNNVAEKPAVAPWYKQFWAWFILSPLLVVIIACSITVTIAFKSRDDVVIDNYYKEGRMINMRFEQDDRAKALGLKGELQFDRQIGEIWLTLESTESLPDSLLLALDHPAQAEKDVQITLRSVAPGRYRGDLETLVDHRWYLRILPQAEEHIAEAAWRLKGEIDFDHSDSVRFALND